MAAKRYILALLSSELGKKRVIIAQKQSVIGKNLPMALFPRDNIIKRIYFENKVQIFIGKQKWKGGHHPRGVPTKEHYAMINRRLENEKQPSSGF